MNENTVRPEYTQARKLNPYFLKTLQEITIIFNRVEEPMFKRQTLIIAETKKHYYYLSFSHDERKNEKIAADQIYRMEKTAMKKFVDIEKAKWLKDLNSDEQLIIIEQLIKNLSFISPLKKTGSVWVAWASSWRSPADGNFLPHCSILEVNYDEKTKCFFPDLIFCHPQIFWNSNRSELKEIPLKKTKNKSDWERIKLNYNRKNEITRILEKFAFYMENIGNDHSNSVLIQLERDLIAIVLYLEDLRTELNQTNKSKNHPLQLKSLYLRNLQKETLFFHEFEQPIFNHKPLIVTETEKHYYYLSFSYDKKIITNNINCMEKSVIKKFIDIEKAKWLKDLNPNEQLIIIEQLIKNLYFNDLNENIGYIFFCSGILDRGSFLNCSLITMIKYHKKEECFLPSAVLCDPEIWNLWVKSQLNKTWLNYSIKDEIWKSLEKFATHLGNDVKGPINSIWARLESDLESIVFYLKDLKNDLEQINKKPKD